MKKYILLIILSMLLPMAAMQAKNLAGVKIYVNPGHGGYDATNDRNVPTIPFAADDHAGFYESTCNLVKGLELQRLLLADGASVMISRTQNRDEDDKALSEIAEEANAFGSDAFIAIHSNALGTNRGTNYLLCLFKGDENASAGVPANATAKEMATKAWPFLYPNNMTVWTGGFSETNMCLKDDFHFLGFYLGVLKPLTVPGFLVEGSFHDYEPETHRLLNADYTRLTAMNLYRFYCSYFGAEMPTTGVLAGAVKDSKRVMTDTHFNNYVKGTHDQYQPINGAKITLMNADGAELKSYTTDNYYNGVYVFNDLTPGTYKVKMEASGYTAQEKSYTVEAAKTTSDYTLLEDPNYVVPPEEVGAANIYASEMQMADKGGAQYDISFTLNADATSVNLKLYDGTELKHTIALGAMPKGKNTANVDLSGMEDKAFSWGIEATGAPFTSDKPVKITSKDNTSLMFTNSRGIAVDNSTESPYFGRVYVTEASAGSTSGRTTQNGLYVLDATFSDVTGQSATSYAGNVAWAKSSSPMRPAVAADGTVYVSDWSDTNSGVWKIDPANLSNAFTPVFGGTLNSDGLASKDGVAIHGSIASCWVTGAKDNTVLYTFDEDYATAPVTNKGGLLQYNIGNLATPWEAAPSAVVYDNADKLEQNFNSVIVPDSKGGWWISQYRYVDNATIPSLIHVKDNKVDFNSSGMMGDSQKGALAINSDETLLAMGCNDALKVFTIGTDDAGVPTLTLKYTISPALGSDSYGLAFDCADNVYLAAGAAGGVAAWALPKAVNTLETKAPLAMSMRGGGTGIENVNAGSISVKMSGSELLISATGSVIGNVVVYSATGSVMCQEHGINALQKAIDTSAWTSGVYIVRAGNRISKVIK